MSKRPRMGDDNSPLNKTGAVLTALVGSGSDANNSTTQKSDKSETQDSERIAAGQPAKPDSQKLNNSSSKEVQLSNSSEPRKPKIRRATFGLDEQLLKQLDRFYLSLKLEITDGEPPYKEVIVEEAIARLLAASDSDKEAVVAALQVRQLERG
ncbi:MAG: hypothetical protein AB4038_09880 [Prochloraceae cyanobacterium]